MKSLPVGLFRRSDGDLEIDVAVRRATGERVRHRERLPHGTNVPTAKRRVAEVQAAMISGSYVSPKAAAQRDRIAVVGRLGAALDAYLAQIPEHQRAHRAAHVRRVVGVLGASRPLAALAPFDMLRLRSAITSELSAASWNRHRSTVLHALTWARRSGLCPADVVLALRDVKAERETARDRTVHADEEAAVAQVDGWLRPFVILARGTAVRLGEACALTWRMVDFSGEGVTLHLPAKATKAGKPRSIPLPPALADAFLTLPRPADLDAFVFSVPGRTGIDEHKRRVARVSRAWAAFARAHGLVGLRLHDLRHDSATRLVESGAPMLAVQRILGHSTATMTARYVGRVPAMAAAAMAAMTVPGIEGGLSRHVPASPAPALRLVKGR